MNERVIEAAADVLEGHLMSAYTQDARILAESVIRVADLARSTDVQAALQELEVRIYEYADDGSEFSSARVDAARRDLLALLGIEDAP
jgi:F0F1-type ATP synthase epsilon subunit